MKNTLSIFLIVILIAAIGGAYWYRTKLSEPARLPTVPTGSALDLIERLERIKIDTSLFGDERFSKLSGFALPSLDGVIKGRENPFLRAGEGRRLTAPSSASQPSASSGDQPQVQF